MRKLLLPVLVVSLLPIACSEEEMRDLGRAVEKVSHESCVKRAMAEYQAMEESMGFEGESPEEVRSALRQAEELLSMIDVANCPATFKVALVGMRNDVKDFQDLVDQMIQEQRILPEMKSRAQRIAESATRHEDEMKRVAASFGWQSPGASGEEKPTSSADHGARSFGPVATP